MPEWIGKTIGKVRIEKFLARGGMAEVYLGTHLTLARPVAVKVLHSFIEEEPIPLERFEREAKVAATMRHPNIVQIHDFDTIDSHPYIVMEYLKGPTLATYLRPLHQHKQRIPHPQVARLLNGLAAALDYAHERGVIHRDVKPGNILLHNKTDEIPLDKTLPEDVEAVLTDFGLVRLVDTGTHTTSGIISGTPEYMSPEQARGDKIDHRSDIYSLGIVLYELLAGRVPFKADHAAVLHMQIHETPLPIPGIQPSVQKVLDRALAKKPEDRYQTARALAADYMDAVGMVAEANRLQMSIPSSRVMAPALAQLPRAEASGRGDQLLETLPSLSAGPQGSSPTLSRSQPPTSAGVRLVALIGIGLLVVGFGTWGISRFSASIRPTAVPTQISQPTDGSAQVHATDQSSLVVNTSADTTTTDGFCSLREAITNANNDSATYPDCTTGAGADTISFAANYTITLVGSQLPAITSTLTINGNGIANTILQASANPSTATYRVLEVANTGNLTLNKLTVRHGRCNGSCPTSERSGGGIYNNDGTLTVTNSTISSNSAVSDGGGILNFNNGTLTVTNSTFSANSGGYGGGISNNGTLEVTDSTFFANSASPGFGGGLYNGHIMTVTNSTLFANSAGNGGGIGNGGMLTVTNSTLSANSAPNGGGIYHQIGAATLYNSIVANSPSGLDCALAGSGTFTADRYNLDTDGSCDNATQRTTAEINLQPLANNGGLTPTMALGTGSLAIDAGNDGICANAPVNREDQRGVTRPQGTGCDVGAYELDNTYPTVVSDSLVASYATTPVGVLRFQDGTAPADAVTISTDTLPLPAAGSQYEAWLIADDAKRRISIGVISFDAANKGSLTFVDSEGRNLLGKYSAMEITVEPSPDSNPNSSNNIAYAVRLPEDGLIHVRNLLFSFGATPNQIGSIRGLDTDTKLLSELGKRLLTAFESGNEPEVSLQAENMLNLIVGSRSKDYKDWNGNGSIDDPGDGYGLLLNGENLGYIQGAFTHADLALTSPNATQNMLTHGDYVKISVINVSDWTAQLRSQLIEIIGNSTNPDREVLIRQAVSIANQIRVGFDEDGNERVEPIPGEGGALTAYEHAYYMADMLIVPVANQTPTP